MGQSLEQYYAQPSPKGSGRFFIGLFALCLAVGAHVLWMMLPVEPFPSTREPVEASAPTIIVLPDSGPGVWSPVLFALPSSIGFSKPVISDEVTTRPPLGQSADLSLPLTAPLWEAQGELAHTTAPVFQTPYVPVTDLKAGQRTTPPSPPRSTGWTLDLVAGNAPEVLVFRPPANTDAFVDGFELRGSIRFDAYGTVRNLVLDRPAGLTKGQRDIVKSLYGARIPRSERNVSAGMIRFHLLYREAR